jgi:hypothetical protein
VAAQSGRYEKRIATVEPVYLSSLDETSPVEIGFTENVSRHGSRVLTRRAWQPGHDIIITSRQGDFRSRARVVYCQHLTGSAIVIGLQLSSPKGDWAGNR